MLAKVQKQNFGQTFGSRAPHQKTWHQAASSLHSAKTKVLNTICCSAFSYNELAEHLPNLLRKKWFTNMLPTLHLQLSHRPQPSGQASIMTRRGSWFES
jgi:hypothetical protein